MVQSVQHTFQQRGLSTLSSWIGWNAWGFDGALNVDITELLEVKLTKPFFFFRFPSVLLCAFKSARSHTPEMHISCVEQPANCMLSQEMQKSKVPDQSGALPAHSLHVDLLCSSHLCGKGLPWAAFRGRDYYVCLRTRIHDGQMWSSPRQVHGLLHDVPRSLFCYSVWKPSDLSPVFSQPQIVFKLDGWHLHCRDIPIWGNLSHMFCFLDSKVSCGSYL